MVRKRRGQKKGKLKQLFVPKNLFIILLIITIIFSGLNIAEAKGWLIPKQPTFEIKDGVINLDSLSLEQKIAQMVINKVEHPVITEVPELDNTSRGEGGFGSTGLTFKKR